LPARTLDGFAPRIRRKDRLHVGMGADIVVIDPETISDDGTYEKPNQPAVGGQTVLVNGGFVVQNGELILDAPHGLPIRRAVTSN
jgi:N-acyl-D-aspartate/D-glutamate deacylase